MAVSTSYNILVSLVNPDPAAITIDYSLISGTERFLEPFISQLGDLASVTYQTQVIRYVTLPNKPIKTGDSYFIAEVRSLDDKVVLLLCQYLFDDDLKLLLVIIPSTFLLRGCIFLK